MELRLYGVCVVSMLGNGKVPCIAVASDSSELQNLADSPPSAPPHILGPRSGCQKSRIRSCAGAGWLCFFETVNSRSA